MKTLQVRNVPDDLHRTLKVRAAREGVSLSDYLLDELRQVADRPTLNELLERIARREAMALSAPAEDLVRAEREAR